MVSPGICPGLVISAEEVISLHDVHVVQDTYVKEVEGCGIYVHEDVLWPDRWLWCVVHESKLRGVFPFVDNVGSHTAPKLELEGV